MLSRDLFQPALDADAAGNVLLAWYDRRNDAGNVDYQQFAEYISPTGTPLAGGIQNVGTVTSRVSRFDGVSGTWVYDYFPGDYHEIFYWNYPDGPRFNDVWIGKPIGSTNGDVWVSEVH